MKSKVYFTKNITPENVVRLYDALGVSLEGKIAAKVHSGEVGNQNFLHPEFWRPIVEHLGATVVECNTAYAGHRNSTKKHLETLEKHGWNEFFDFDLLDAEGPDDELKIENGKKLTHNFVGKNLKKYDSLVVLSHFKGHPMGGYGGALKQLSIGLASTKGKCVIHSAGKVDNQLTLWANTAPQDDFLESMADAAGSIMKLYKDKSAFINVMANMSVDCDCCAKAEDPCISDIGILASLDPVAIDQACIDLVKNSDDEGKEHFLERVSSRHGEHTIETAAELGLGSREYELIEL